MEKIVELSLLPGKKYAVRVTANTDSGQGVTSQVYILNTGTDTSAPPDVSNLTATFSGTGVISTWNGSAAKATPDFRYFEITISSSNYPSVSKIFYTNSETFTLDINTNRSIFGAASGVVSIQVKSIDRTGNKSAGVIVNATNSVPSDPTNVVASSAVLGYNVSWTQTTDTDYDYTRVYESSSISGTYSVVATSTGSTVFVPSTNFTPRYIKVSHVDFFGQESSLVQSSPSNVTPQNPISSNVDPPTDPSGLSFETPRLVSVAGIDTSSTLAYWICTDSNTTGYKIRLSRNQENWQVYDVPAIRATVSNKSLTSNVATLTLNSHSFSVGDYVTVFGIDAIFNGTYKITNVTTNTISYNKTNTNIPSESTAGLVIASSYDITNLITGTLYYAGILAYDAENNLTQFVSPNSFTTAGSTPSIGTAISVDGASGTMKFGPSAGGSGNDGLYINSSNYWYDTGRFKLGTPGNSVDWDGVRLRIDGDLRARSGVFSGNVFITDGSVFAANSLNISSATWSSNVATITTSTNHSYVVGDRIVISQTSSGFDGNYTISTIPSSNTFTVSLVPSSGFTVSSVSTGKVANLSRGARTIFDNSGIISYDSSNNVKFVLSNTGSNSIAGWSITTSSISSGSINLNSATSQITAGSAGLNGAASPNGADGTPIRIWSGSASPSTSSSFYVTNNGYLVATNANISGSITATSGSFTGTINVNGVSTFSSYIQAGSSPYIRVGAAVDGANNGIYFSNGDYWLANNFFRVGGASGISYSGGTISLGSNVSFGGNITRGSDYWNTDSSFQLGGTEGIRKGASGGIAIGTSVSISGPITGSVFRTTDATNINRIVIDGVSQKDTIQFVNSQSGNFNMQISGYILNIDNNYDIFGGTRFTLPPEVRIRSKLRVAPNNSQIPLEIYRQNSTGNETIASFSSNFSTTEGLVTRILVNGNLQNLNGGYGTISDERLKINIEPSRQYLNDLMGVEVIKYSFTENPDNRLLGFSAQQIQTVFPNIVEEDENGYLGVKTSVLIPMLVTAVQELNNRVKYLEDKLEEMNV